MNTPISKHRRLLSRLATIVLLVVTLGAHTVSATTYISVEPIPSGDVVGQATLDRILSAGYANLERWSTRLLDDCGIVEDVIGALRRDGAISTVRAGNFRVRVGAGGFEAVTNPSFIFTLRDSGPEAVSAADIAVLDNALGYVLNQGGTVHFSPDNPKAYDFALDYAVVSFRGVLEGLEAKAFFEYLGTVDQALFSGPLAGFTQIDFEGSPTNNSMLFLQPATSKHQFVSGLFTAASTTDGARYVTLKDNGQPTTAQAGVAFPGNDWVEFPNGDQYLANLGNVSERLLKALACLRQRHLRAVADLVAAIHAGDVEVYLETRFTCPAK
jgi:hypothetical protein